VTWGKKTFVISPVIVISASQCKPTHHQQIPLTISKPRSPSANPLTISKPRSPSANPLTISKPAHHQQTPLTISKPTHHKQTPLTISKPRSPSVSSHSPFGLKVLSTKFKVANSRCFAQYKVMLRPVNTTLRSV
jgi:hypothetical protein